MNRPVVHPPTNTSSSSTGASRRTTDSNRARFGSATEKSPKLGAELPLSQLALAYPSVPKSVDQCKEFVEHRVLQGSLGRGPVQRLKRDTGHVTFHVRPDGRKVPLDDLSIQWRSGMRRSPCRGWLHLAGWERRTSHCESGTPQPASGEGGRSGHRPSATGRGV